MSAVQPYPCTEQREGERGWGEGRKSNSNREGERWELRHWRHSELYLPQANCKCKHCVTYTDGVAEPHNRLLHLQHPIGVGVVLHVVGSAYSMRGNMQG